MRTCIPAVLLACSAVPLLGQGYRATIVGRVTDPTGAVVAGARISAANVNTNIEVRTESDSTGNYTLPPVIPGRYRVTAEAAGFKTFVRDEITLQVDQAVRVDIPLEVGAVSEQIVVKAEAPVVNTENPTLGSVITNQEILDMPLNGRNYLGLAYLSPGVQPSPQGANPYNINGARSDHVNYLVDGISNVGKRGNNPVANPSIDAIQEYKIITNGFSAEYGRLGAGVISLALKSGTNRFHGRLYDFLRNDTLDARNFFAPTVAKLKRNQFGAVLDGPIVRNRAFFLVSYEGSRVRTEQERLTRVPTAEERQGIFATAVRDPLTGRPFPGNRIPADRIHPVAAKVIPRFPAPNRAAVVNLFSASGAPSDGEAWIVKIDNQLTAADQVAVRFLYNEADQSLPFRSTNLPGFGSLRDTRKQQWGLTWTRIFSPVWINEARLGYARDSFREASVNYGQSPATELGIPSVTGPYGMPNMAITGFPQIGDAIFLPDIWNLNEFPFSDTVSRSARGHNLRFGFEFQRSQHFALNNSFLNPQFNFLGSFTGNAFADFLLGMPVRTQRQVGQLKTYLFSSYYGGFFQDDWKVTPRLTLNLGVRYDLIRPPAEKYDRWANFVIAERRSVLATEPGYPRAMVRTDTNNFSPRFGFAWRPERLGGMVLRGGYGIYYAFDLQHTMYTLLGRVYPFARNEQYEAIAPGNPSLSDPFPTNRPGAAPGADSPGGWDYENPGNYVQQWNFTLSREIVPGLGVDASYVGTKSTHGSTAANINQTIRTPQGNIVPYPGFGIINFASLGSNASYHSLQVAVRRRFSGGFAMNSNFTWSKAIDYLSYGSLAPQNPLDLRSERGLASFDRRRNWNTDLVYQLPFGRGRRFGGGMGRALDLAAGGWQLNAILQAYDGFPFTPSYSRGNARAGEPTRPDRIGSGKLAKPTIERWFDPSAFVPVPLDQYRFGNSGRNILTGPGGFEFDASIFKEFALPIEGHRIQFRAEFFNFLNHPTFGQPAAAIDQPTAGIISGSSAGRQIQFALKYIF